MKKRLFSTLVMVLLLVACNQKNNEEDIDENLMLQDTTVINNDRETLEIKEVVYACSMHPEVTGKSDDNCPKCGMGLTEVVE